jgi:hypothetical protein
MAMRNIGPACGEAGAPTAVLTSVIRPAAGALSEIGPLSALLLLSRRRLGRAQARQLLVLGNEIAFLDKNVVDLGAFLVGADYGLAARDEMPGRPDQVGEAGIGGFGHDDLGLDRSILFLRLGPMLPPVISAG